jgi:hypothetical protein
MKNYRVKAKLKHDKGTVNLGFLVSIFEGGLSQATQQAIDMLMKAEGCPENAIKSITVTPMK